MKYIIYYKCENCMEEIYCEEAENREEAENAVEFMDYCANCKSIHNLYPNRIEKK